MADFLAESYAWAARLAMADFQSLKKVYKTIYCYLLREMQADLVAGFD